ncbi:uncharacterized protein LOC113798379 [Dermatophagoides pteronyssinus]|uniref:uncharacterized protein LOC113798379 n=1 Tax=Dermatophagoides pteronyssinus TaxID=6956 RepID=UPI003F665A5F
MDYDSSGTYSIQAINVNNNNSQSSNSFQYPVILNNAGIPSSPLSNNNHFILPPHQQQQQNPLSSGSSHVHNNNNNNHNHHHLNNNPNHYHGVDIDTATIVSIASSCIILISGCIAVVCLIMYMKKTDMLYRSRTCAKCGAHVAHPTNVSIPGNLLTNNIQETDSDLPAGTPISIRSENVVRSAERAEHVAKVINYQMAAKSQPNLAKEIDSIVIYRGMTNNGQQQQQQALQQTSKQQQQQQQPSLTTAKSATNDQIHNQTVAQNTNTCLDFLTDAFKNETKTSFIEDDEAAPYATFNLPGFESDSKISDTYETFAAKFSEPPYMLLKKGIECPPQYADSIDCKLRILENIDKNNIDPIYQSNVLSHYHSIASCGSSNQDELIRAYEFGNEQKQKLLQLQDEFIKQLANENNDSIIAKQETIYRSIPISDHESPTDPGIREFTKSPPKPNEKRQGIVFHHQPTVADILKMSQQLIDSKEFSAKTSLTHQQPEEISSNETSKSLSSLKASSGGIDDDDDDSTPSGGSELGNDEASSSTPTPENLTTDDQQQQSQPQQQQLLVDNKKNFGAISRDRSRNPSWANYTTMKSNTVLAIPTSSLQQPTIYHQNQQQQQQQANLNKRAFVTIPDMATGKEFSSVKIDDDDDEDDDIVDDDDDGDDEDEDDVDPIKKHIEMKEGLSSDDYDDIIMATMNNNSMNIIDLDNKTKTIMTNDENHIDSSILSRNYGKTTNKSPTTLLDSIAQHMKQTYGSYDYHPIDTTSNHHMNIIMDNNKHQQQQQQQDIFALTKSSYEDNLSLLLAAEAESLSSSVNIINDNNNHQNRLDNNQNVFNNNKNNDNYHQQQKQQQQQFVSLNKCCSSPNEKIITTSKSEITKDSLNNHQIDSKKLKITSEIDC